jgi:tetratricopeptide (TPR) repeat protein
MNRKEIWENHQLASDFIAKRQLGNALDLFYQMAAEANSDYYQLQLDKHKETYSSILQYAFKEMDDPQRDEIYFRLLKDILEIGDKLKEHLLTITSGSSVYKTKWKIEQNIQDGKIDYNELLSNLTKDDELDDLLKDTNITTQEGTTSATERNEVISDLFRVIWLVDKYGEDEIALLNNVNSSEKLPWHDKSLFVSALTLSMLRCFDENKIELLFKFFNKKEDQVWQRALVGLLLTLYKYDERVELYPGILQHLDSLKGNPELEKNIEAIIIQTIKSKETEEITRKWEQEILPEIMKMRPNIEQKLDLENIVSDKFIEDKNPDWERVFEDSPDLLDKLQEFSKLQMEGSDVFMSAFGRLKHFPFFNRISNWFLPFYKENSDLKAVFPDDQETNIFPLIEKLENSYYMCNSDKYSFCFNLQYIPDEQRNTMMQMFNEEMKQMNEIGEDDEILTGFARTKSIYTQYLQDLYRFYKLHPLRNEVDDIFDYKLDIYNTHFYKRIVENKKIRRNIAEFYFERDHFNLAVEVFQNLDEDERNKVEILEKIAYSYQRLGDYQNALDYYLKADLFDTNKAWLTKKIALCYRYLNQTEKSLEYYKAAEAMEPDNLYIQAYIGHSLFQLGRYEEATKYYFKVEYLAPENAKIRRPIAWCSFMLGKFETAENYLHKLLEKESNYYDYITLGHVYWSMKQPEKAQEAYKNAILHQDSSFEKFSAAFLDDKKYLKNQGIEPLDINLMMDRVKFLAEQESKNV